MILFYFSEKIIQYSRTFAQQVQTSWNQAHGLLLVESIPKTSRTRSEASQSIQVWWISQLQNKLPSFIDSRGLRGSTIVGLDVSKLHKLEAG